MLWSDSGVTRATSEQLRMNGKPLRRSKGWIYPLCSLKSKRRWNVERHIRRQHSESRLEPLNALTMETRDEKYRKHIVEERGKSGSKYFEAVWTQSVHSNFYQSSRFQLYIAGYQKYSFLLALFCIHKFIPLRRNRYFRLNRRIQELSRVQSARIHKSNLDACLQPFCLLSSQNNGA